MTTIVAATDFSTAGNGAVLRAAALAAHMGARLHVFHAASFRIAPEQAEHFASLVEGYFDTLRARIQCRFGPEIEVDCTDATAWRAIHEALDREETALLVVGPHVHPNGLDTFHGTFVERLLADCPVPVLVSMSPPKTPYRAALVTTDAKAPREAAMGFVRAIAPEAEVETMRIDPRDLDEKAACGEAQVEGGQDRKIMAPGGPRARIETQVSAHGLDLVALTGADPLKGLDAGFVKTPPCDLLIFAPLATQRPARMETPVAGLA
ncbi:universal stress protein [Limimaricola litoreus]|uniref:Universal stress protein n=1 Tax=Limimaricola litoreus TaxID=2955316 RepID=A0A9X2FSI8_9RHOB|nr:universal stress protein [Limimaricola litoreus]MCP1169450.1 universal stress protein [Limimaricola litoreus]